MDRSRFRSAPRVAKAKGQLREGFRYVRRTPELRLPLVMMAVVGTFAFNYQVTLPLLAERTFGGDATTFTLLFATLSLGSVAGALMVAHRRELGLRFLVRMGAGLAVSTLALTLAPTLPLALPPPWPSASPTSASSRAPTPSCSCGPPPRCGVGCWRCSASSSSAPPRSEARSSAGSPRRSAPAPPWRWAPSPRAAIVVWTAHLMHRTTDAGVGDADTMSAADDLAVPASQPVAA